MPSGTGAVPQTRLIVIVVLFAVGIAALADDASRATRAELESLRSAAHDLAATSRRLQEAVG